MSMLPDGIIPILTGNHGQVLDFVWETGHALVTDYHRLDQRIFAEDSVEMRAGGKQQRVEVTSVEKLSAALEEFVSFAIDILSQYTPFDPSDPYTRRDFSSLKKELLVEQLVFDVLFDKYIKESPLMTRNGYATYISKIVYSNDDQRIDRIPAIERNLARGIKDHSHMMKYSKLKNQLKMLGVDPDKFDEYYNPKTRDNPNKDKPKCLWDYFYYNYGLKPRISVLDDECDHPTQYGKSTITSRQYRRQLTRESRNYSYEEIVNDLKSYNVLATKLLPAENESYEKYFRMSMDYYTLESYKRLDYMFKLIETLDPSEIATIDKNHFLVSRFVPLVLVPFVQDSELYFKCDYKYYEPLFIIEETLRQEWLFKKVQFKEAFPQEVQAVNNHCERYYESLLKKHQYVRAKAYELFRYHCTFRSNDYVEIKKFLRECYDMRSYHQSTTFWNLIQDNDWRNMDNKTKQHVAEHIRHFLSINDAFFWKSSDRDYTIPETNK